MLIKDKRNHTIQSYLAKGIIESDIKIVTGYPGWPATSILEDLIDERNFHIEWSINEKQAVALAAGASLVGERAAVLMKHVGVNVASDAIMGVALNEQLKGGLVFIVGDDPGGIHSQNEQDTRVYSDLFNIPILEPSSYLEAKQIVKHAFVLSEKFKIPLLIRFIDRFDNIEVSLDTAYLGKQEQKKEGSICSKFKQCSSGSISEKHFRLREKLKDVSQEIHSLNYDRLLTGEVNNPRYGIITSGPISNIVMSNIHQYINDNKDYKFSIFKISTVNPFPIRKINTFLGQVNDILVIEEGSPWIEKNVLSLINSKKRILGKLSGDIPFEGYLQTNDIDQAILKLVIENKQVFKDFKDNIRNREGMTYYKWHNIQKYPPVKVCHKALKKATRLIRKNVLVDEDIGLRWQNVQNCPVKVCHKALKKAIQLIRENIIIIGDLGCVNQGQYKSYNTIDTSLCMGVSASVAAGISLSNYDGKVIAIMGDSSFLHSGIQALMNAVYQKANITFLIFDNQTTGETGRQPNPGTGLDIKGEKNIQIKIEDLVKACQVDRYKVLDAHEIEQNCDYISSFLEMKGINVLILRAPCPENCIPE